MKKCGENVEGMSIMKGLIFYFSSTGTTKLDIQYIASKINNIEFDFHDMNNKSIPDINQYTILGFATYAQLFSPPQYVKDFIERIVYLFL